MVRFYTFNDVNNLDISLYLFHNNERYVEENYMH